MEPDQLITLGVAAAKIGGGVQHHHLHRLAVRGRIPFVRVGRLRVLRASDLDGIITTCERCGYLKREATARA